MLRIRDQNGRRVVRRVFGFRAFATAPPPRRTTTDWGAAEVTLALIFGFAVIFALIFGRLACTRAHDDAMPQTRPKMNADCKSGARTLALRCALPAAVQQCSSARTHARTHAHTQDLELTSIAPALAGTAAPTTRVADGRIASLRLQNNYTQHARVAQLVSAGDTKTSAGVPRGDLNLQVSQVKRCDAREIDANNADRGSCGASCLLADRGITIRWHPSCAQKRTKNVF